MKNKKIELLVRDPDNTIEEILKFIEFYSGIGHSFEVQCDPENTDDVFFIDGDGEDKLDILRVEEISESDYGKILRRKANELYNSRNKRVL